MDEQVGLHVDEDALNAQLHALNYYSHGTKVSVVVLVQTETTTLILGRWE